MHNIYAIVSHVLQRCAGMMQSASTKGDDSYNQHQIMRTSIYLLQTYQHKDIVARII